jgi:hypothetical protein
MFTEADRKIAALARQQHQVFTLDQARAAGLSDDQAAHRLVRGVWQQVGSGVYAPASAEVTTRGRVHAATLTVPGSVASHESAGEMRAYPLVPEGLVVVSRPDDQPNRTSLGIVRRVCDFDPRDHTTLDGIPVTTSVRTAADLAAVLGAGRYQQMIDHLITTRVFLPDDLADVAARWCRRGRRGSGLLWRTVAARGAGYVAPESELEARGLALLAVGGLPAPQRQLALPWRSRLPGRVDCGYPELQVLIEWDSRKHHLIEAQFELDRRRDDEAIACGWAPLRFTWKMIHAGPSWVIEMTTATLRSRRALRSVLVSSPS